MSQAGPLPRSEIVPDLGAPGLYDGVAFPMWTVYDHPIDFPDHFVMRLFDGMTSKPTDKVFLAKSMDEILRVMPGAFFCIKRDDADDPKIICTYI